MPDALLWNGSEGGAPATSWAARLLTDGAGSLLYKPSGPFTGDTSLIRQGRALEPLLGDDLVKGYWLDTAINRWRPVPLSGFSQAVLNGFDFPIIALADGRIVYGRHTAPGAGLGSVIDLWTFDPATCAWAQHGQPYTSTEAFVGWIGTEPVIVDTILDGIVLRWNGSAWATHSNPNADLSLDVRNIDGFRLLGGIPTLFGGFRRNIGGVIQWTSAIGWNGSAWFARSNWLNSTPGATDMVAHNGLLHYRASNTQIVRINADGSETAFAVTPIFGGPLGTILRLGSFNGGLYVLGKFDQFFVQANDAGPLASFAASNIARITLEPPGVFDVGGGLQRGTSPFDPNFHQLLVEGGKLWVGSRFMDTVNNGAQAVPYDLAAWDGAAWTIPPAAPKGGWTGFGRVITPGDPF